MKFVMYKDRKKDWRWHLMSKGRVIADSGEGYKRRGVCRRIIERIISNVNGATIEDE